MDRCRCARAGRTWAEHSGGAVRPFEHAELDLSAGGPFWAPFWATFGYYHPGELSGAPSGAFVAPLFMWVYLLVVLVLFVNLLIAMFNAKYKEADVEDFELGYRLRCQYGKIKYISKLRVHHRYPSLWKQFKLYFKRIRMWMDLKASGEGFDESFGMRRKDAIIQILSAVWPFALILSLALGFFLPGLVFLLAALWTNRKFVTLCLREEGILFVFMSVLCHSFLAIAVLAGAFLELVRKPQLIFGIIGKGVNNG